MKVYTVVIRSSYPAGGDELACLGVFQKITDARKAMNEDFRERDYDKRSCEQWSIMKNRIYVVGSHGFSCDHYWAEIVKLEIR